MSSPPKQHSQATLAEQLLHRAARCYEHVQWTEDACRLYAELGSFRIVGHFREQQGLWSEAAAFYARAGAWLEAARCYQRAERPADAARCLHQAGETLTAAWLWANESNQAGIALGLVENFQPSNRTEELSLALIHARCALSRRDPRQAAQGLRQVLARLPELEESILNRKRLTDWAECLAQVLERPDLMAQIHAVRCQCRLPGAASQWEAWACHQLGDKAFSPPLLDRAGENRTETEEEPEI